MSQAERFQRLCAWLYAPTKQEQRHYLETNLVLLAYDTEHLLSSIVEDNAGIARERSYMYEMRLLQDIRRRGGKVEDVREGYVNEYGGFILDLPAWLAKVVYDFTCMPPMVEQSVRERTKVKLICKEALEQGYNDKSVMAEVLAELHYWLGYAFFVDISGRSTQQIATVIKHYETALQVYTPERYPKQHAKLCSALDSLCPHPQSASLRFRLQNNKK